MKVLTGCLLTAFLTSVFAYSYAQTGTSSAKGKILTENRTPVEFATILLLKYADSSIVKSTISSQSGQFQFDGIKPGAYTFLIHKIGYERFYTGKTRINNGDIDIGDIILRSSNTNLQEVAITDKRDYIEVTSDKTVLNIDKSILAAGNSAYDILNTAPGVRIINDVILFKGGQKALVTIDGKPISAFSDEQLADVLKSYQSDMISQVELIANPSAKYDAAGGGGVINIILKKNRDIGFKGSFTESAALGQDYKLNSGVNLNYNTRKLDLFGSFNFNDNQIKRFLNLNRIINSDGDKSDFDLNYQSTTATKNYSFNTGADYNITPKQTVGALVYGYTNKIGIDKNNMTKIKNNGVLDSNINTWSHIDRHITNLNYNLNYKGAFGKEDKTSLSADFDYSTYNRSSSELLQSDFFDESGQAYRPSLFYTDNSPSKINVRSEKIDFMQVLSNTGSISAGIKNNQVNSNNNINFEQRIDTGSTFLPVPALTDHFIYNERINAAYVNYNDKINKTAIALGLRAEQTNAHGISLNPNNTGKDDYFALFPNIQLMQPLDTDNTLTMGYNRRILRPDYQDLNPFVAYIDQYAYSVGNPFLTPEFINTYAVSDVYKSKYKITLSYIKTRDFFISIFQQNDSTKVYTTTNKNIGTYYQYMTELSFPVNVTNWWKADVYIESSYNRIVYKADSASKSTYELSLNITQDFNITSKLKAELEGEYDTPTFYGISNIKSICIVNAGISQSIFNNRASIKLAVSDIFNSDQYRYSSNYLNLNLRGMQKPGTRFVMATFTYHFGKQSVKNVQKRVGGNFDDQLRLGGGNEN